MLTFGWWSDNFDKGNLELQLVWGEVSVQFIHSLPEVFEFSKCEHLKNTQNQRIPSSKKGSEVDTNHPKSSGGHKIQGFSSITISGQVHEILSRFSKKKKKDDCYERWCFERWPTWWQKTKNSPKFQIVSPQYQ